MAGKYKPYQTGGKSKAEAATKTRVTAIKHPGHKRVNNPSIEMQSLVGGEETVTLEYARKTDPKSTPKRYKRDGDLDPQLMWDGKEQDDQDGVLRVDAPPIFVQEKILPQAIIEDLQRAGKQGQRDRGEVPEDMFQQTFGVADVDARVEFYQHRENWSNRMILGDSLQVMASLAHKEMLKGQVQCIYMDPPYGIKFAGNWQQSTKSTVGSDKEISGEPEVVRAFRDTWEKGIHSYLSYLRDRLTAARDLLTESGSIFVQIADENVHLVRCVLDEVFGMENFVNQIGFRTSMTKPTTKLNNVFDYLLWYAKDKQTVKFRPLFIERSYSKESEIVGKQQIEAVRKQAIYEFVHNGKTFNPKKGWRVSQKGLQRLAHASRLHETKTLSYIRYAGDFLYKQTDNIWVQQMSEIGNKLFVVQTNIKPVQRCLLMTTDPGDLVLDPTCGSGTTAFVAEHWGRRWITCDTSRVALAMARKRMMGARFPYYLMRDSIAGAKKYAHEYAQSFTPKDHYGEDVQHGFVYRRARHITLRDIANNPEIDQIHEAHQDKLEKTLTALNNAAQQNWQEWEVPRESEAFADTNPKALKLYAEYHELARARQAEINESIERKAHYEELVDCPYEDENSGTVRVAGPFSVESLSPHRILPIDSNDETLQPPRAETEVAPKLIEIVRENLLGEGIGNTKKGERLHLQDIRDWAGKGYVHLAATNASANGGASKRVAICVGPEYGTVSKSFILQAAREASDMFDMLVVLGFAFEAYTDQDNLNVGKLRVHCVEMNKDLWMADRLKAGRGGNLFVLLGEPDIECRRVKLGADEWEVEVKGVDIFDPNTGDISSRGVEDIACWMIDTDYSGDNFFVRHAYFYGKRGDKDDPYRDLQKALRAEIDEQAWETLFTSVSRPFPKPETGKIAVKAINHYGNEVIKVFSDFN